MGHISNGYLDDSFLVGYSLDECQTNIRDTLALFKDLGFFPHEEKSVTTPTQEIHHLGFVLNSIDMTVSLSGGKYKKFQELAQGVLDKATPNIRKVTQLIGMMVSSFPGIDYGELYFRQVEIE